MLEMNFDILVDLTLKHTQGVGDFPARPETPRTMRASSRIS